MIEKDHFPICAYSDLNDRPPKDHSGSWETLFFFLFLNVTDVILSSVFTQLIGFLQSSQLFLYVSSCDWHIIQFVSYIYISLPGSRSIPHQFQLTSTKHLLLPNPHSTDSGFFEEAQYRFNSNASDPQCITAYVLWQHGKYQLNNNGSITLYPFGSDGRIQVQDPCAAVTNVITTYDQIVSRGG